MTDRDKIMLLTQIADERLDWDIGEHDMHNTGYRCALLDTIHKILHFKDENQLS